jgi:hypothetical protein
LIAYKSPVKGLVIPTGAKDEEALFTEEDRDATGRWKQMRESRQEQEQRVKDLLRRLRFERIVQPWRH